MRQLIERASAAMPTQQAHMAGIGGVMREPALG
jgi:hypothetical protein